LQHPGGSHLFQCEVLGLETLEPDGLLPQLSLQLDQLNIFMDVAPGKWGRGEREGEGRREGRKLRERGRDGRRGGGREKRRKEGRRERVGGDAVLCSCTSSELLALLLRSGELELQLSLKFQLVLLVLQCLKFELVGGGVQ